MPHEAFAQKGTYDASAEITRNKILDIRHKKPETRNQKQKTRNKKPETRNQKQKTNRNTQTATLKHQQTNDQRLLTFKRNRSHRILGR